MNKPRLIDANELYTNYCNMFEKSVDDGEMDRMVYAISHQPTAYDVQSVVEQLEALPNLAKLIDRDDAIEIVRNGGGSDA